MIRSPNIRIFLLALQIFQVAILLLHDWVPAAPLNNLKAIRQGHSLPAIALGTLISSLLPSIGLALSFVHWNSGWSAGLVVYLLAAYGFLFLGELEAWWIPYLFWPQPRKAAHYEALFAGTSAFLPARNGIRINTLHCVLHAATLTTVLSLVLLLLLGH